MTDQTLGYTVGKRPSGSAPPNMVDYEETRAQFSWAAARAELEVLPGGGLNIAHEAVDRHLGGEIAQKTALR